MKKIIFILFMASLCLVGCKKDELQEQPKDDPEPQAKVDPLAADRKRCYLDDVENQTITFIFDSTLWKAKNVKSVDVRGSFNNWKPTDGYTLQKCDTAKEWPYWSVTLPYADIRFPGNCGQPEYKFVVNGSSWQKPQSWLTAGYKFPGNDVNQIIVFSDDDIEEIKEKSKIASKKKTLSDFDLETEGGRMDISNVRVVPATTKLIRSYHPFKFTDKNRNRNITEFKRVDIVKEYYESYGVKSDICLSEDETDNLESLTADGITQKETISEYYQGLIDNDKILYVGLESGVGTPSYEVCYSDPKGDKVMKWMAEIIDFIADESNEAPFSIHCRLGTDRTGFFCALIAALCGADYTQVLDDYQMSNNMGIMEYRDAKKLKYTLEIMLDTDDLSTVSDLRSAIANILISSGYTTQTKIDAMVSKLK